MSHLSWDLLNIIGTVAFAVSGAIVAMEEEYDMLGVYLLALVTAFGGGATRNLLIGVPVSALWEQGGLFAAALAAVTLVFVIPSLWFRFLKQWRFFDAVGLAAFAIQGAMYAVEMDRPLIAIVAAALLTGSGGGVIRDVLAGRKPLIFHDEIYGLWAMLAGLMIALGWGREDWELFALLALIVTLRMLSIARGWKLPKRKIRS